ncbi:putative tetratricopeptide TPR_1 repeat-containing protein [Weissella oryzae SG25]|uniref:Putative tetratricopeptide TPR_1 repeat-containing protein n=1 Tax=Weissella oryzae (strain DSM 25784 / JCM 18191 / LMG 30913 / SG25) TaxID=1329250 RepID=A0A069CU52_WEIOS|nr:hypothetical protein [Weissella oryzae]GAK30748.1 putative tetratricopeptide TPR_1 repeat-containing protein [Weissella oryzae SG25]
MAQDEDLMLQDLEVNLKDVVDQLTVTQASLDKISKTLSLVKTTYKNPKYEYLVHFWKVKGNIDMTLLEVNTLLTEL